MQASTYWIDDLSLSTRAIQIAPDSTIAQMYYGNALTGQHRCADALPVLKRAFAATRRDTAFTW